MVMAALSDLGFLFELNTNLRILTSFIKLGLENLEKVQPLK